MFAMVRDLVLTAVVLCVLMAIFIALPFMIFMIVILGVGWLVHAYIHDERINRKGDD